MLHVLTHNILPVFSMLALGFLLGRTKHISRTEASAINRVAFLVLQPALIFPMIATLDFAAFEWRATAYYAVCQWIAFGTTYAICRKVFGREVLESWLLAMAVIFVNSLLYVWPIAKLIYGDAGTLPVTAIVAWDSTFSFSFFIISTDLMANRGSGGRAAARRVLTNPVLIAITAGVVVNLISVTTPVPILTAMDFAGAAAAPLTLFALGVILSGHALMPSPVIASVAGLKLIAFPLLVWIALSLVALPTPWPDLTLMTSAGPSGAMAFALAMLYGVRTDAIAPVIIWTSVLSLISLAALA